MNTRNILCGKVLTLSTILLAMLSSCSNELDENGKNDNVAIFTATAAGNDGSNTRTEYSYADNKLAVTWSSTDHFWAYNDNKAYDFSTQAGSGKSADFTSSASISDGTAVPCIYPYSSNRTVTDGKAELDLSVQQGTIDNLKDIDYMYALASVSGNKATLAFSHKVAFLHLTGLNFGTTNSGKTVKSMQIIGEGITPQATISLSDGSLTNKSASAITITPASPFSIAADGTIADVYAAIFPIATTGNDIFVTATLSDGTVYYTTWTQGKAYQAGKMYKKSSSTMTQPSTYKAIGKGTSTSPWLLYNATQMKSLSTTSETLTGNYLTMMNNIDLSSVCSTDNSWTPIGENNAFQGIFDGGGYTISNLKIYSDKYDLGLFGQISNATVKNLTVRGIVNANAITIKHASGIIAHAENSTITNCHNKCDVLGYATFNGGVAGYIESSSISNSSNTGKLQSNSITGVTIVQDGGIVGQALTNSTIINCFNSGVIASTVSNGSSDILAERSLIGGIAGSFEGVAKSCYNTGKINPTGNDYASGGLFGDATDSSIIGCYNIGDVIDEESNSFSGGLIGLSSAITIEGCYNIGNVSSTVASSYYGAIIGVTGTATFNNIYYLKTTSVNSNLMGIGYNLTSETELTKNTTDKTGTQSVNAISALNSNVSSLNAGITAWNTANAANMCLFHFVAGGNDTTPPTLSSGKPD